jgi:hypothetical protein
MAPKPDRLAFIFGIVLAMALILAITTWAAQTPLRETIYQPQHWNLH